MRGDRRRTFDTPTAGNTFSHLIQPIGHSAHYIMITWIQTRFQTGYKILFFLVLIVVIVAFVFTIGEAPGMGRGGDRGEPMEYFGYDLRSRPDQQEITRLAAISFYTSRGRDPGEQLEQYAFNRLAYLGTGRQMGLPAPTDRELQQFIATRDAFRGPDGRFDPEPTRNTWTPWRPIPV